MFKNDCTSIRLMSKYNPALNVCVIPVALRISLVAAIDLIVSVLALLWFCKIIQFFLLTFQITFVLCACKIGVFFSSCMYV